LNSAQRQGDFAHAVKEKRNGEKNIRLQFLGAYIATLLHYDAGAEPRAQNRF